MNPTESERSDAGVATAYVDYAEAVARLSPEQGANRPGLLPLLEGRRMSTHAAKLVRVANQIANEFEHQQGANAAEATWDHIWHFWDPGMRDAIIALEAASASGLTKTAAAAVRRLATERIPEPLTRATEFGIDSDGNTEGDAG